MIKKMKPLELLKEHCKFEEDKPFDCYVILAIARKKYNAGFTQNTEVVHRFVIKQPKDVERKYNNIKAMVDASKHNFYIYISVNPRNALKAHFILQQMYGKWLQEHISGSDNIAMKFKRVDNQFYSALMQPASRSGKTWVVDVDTKDKNLVQDIVDELTKYTRLIRKVETVNGYHLLIDPFNRQDFILTHSGGLCVDWRDVVDIKTDALLFVENVKNE